MHIHNLTQAHTRPGSDTHERSNRVHHLLANSTWQGSIVHLRGLQAQFCYTGLCYFLFEILNFLNDSITLFENLLSGWNILQPYWYFRVLVYKNLLLMRKLCKVTLQGDWKSWPTIFSEMKAGNKCISVLYITCRHPRVMIKYAPTFTGPKILTLSSLILSADGTPKLATFFKNSLKLKVSMPYLESAWKMY